MPAVGIVDGTQILAGFDTASPGKFTEMKSITGLAAGETMLDLDYRWHPDGSLSPQPPSQLFGVAVTPGVQFKVRLYTIDIETGAATPVGAAFGVTPNGNNYGIDFNPTADRIRGTTNTDANFRINPNNGVRADSTPDAILNPAGAHVSGVAYDRVDILSPPAVASNTTAYAIGTNPGTLYTIGGLNSAPSPNTGALSNPKPLGVTLGTNEPVGFDISPTGTAYAALLVGEAPGLYTVNLSSGAATLIGNTPEPLRSIAIVPAPTPGPVSAPVVVVTDKTAPTVTLDGVKGSLSLQAFLKGIAIKVQANEPASVDAELLAAPKSAKLASFNLILASNSLALGAGVRTLTLKPSKHLVGKPAKAFKVSLRVTATDASGNTGAATKTIKIKPAAKKQKR